MSHGDPSKLVDRLVAGERLSPDETRRLEDAGREDPARAQELALLDRLAAFVDEGSSEPNAESIAIAHAALARVRGGERGSSHAAPSRPGNVSRAVLVAVASLAAAAAVVGLAWSWPRAVPDDAVVVREVADARLTIAIGEVTLDGRAIGDAPPLLGTSTTIAVREGRACLAIDPRIELCLDRSTTASIEAPGGPQTVVDVRRGHAIARLEPLAEGHTFALGSAEVRVVAVGTIFSIDVNDDGSSITAAVLDGVVEVQTGDTKLRLGAHEVVRVHAGGLERARLSADAEARDLDLIASAPDLQGEIGYVAIEVAPADAEVFVDDRAVGRSPVMTALRVGEHRIELRGADGARLGETVGVREGTIVARRFALSGGDAPSVREPSPAEPSVGEPSPAEPSPAEVDVLEIVDDGASPDVVAPDRPRGPTTSPRALLAEARTLRREDRWADAATTYRRLLRDHPRSSEAHTASVSLGDLLLDRLGEPEQAARAYLRYIRDGGGVLAPEARWGIIRARREQKDARAERKAIDDFIRHHPDDARAESLR